MLLQMALFCSFLLLSNYSIVYMYHIFFIHSSVNGHLSCFHVLAIVNSAAMKERLIFLIPYLFFLVRRLMLSYLLKNSWRISRKQFSNCSVTQTNAFKFCHIFFHLPLCLTHPPPLARWHLFGFHRVVMTFICISESDSKTEKC